MDTVSNGNIFFLFSDIFIHQSSQRVYVLFYISGVWLKIP